MMSAMKVCSKCKEQKAPELFYKDSSAKDGRKYSCIDCCKSSRNKEKERLYREANKDKLNSYKRKYDSLDRNKKREYYLANRENILEKRKKNYNHNNNRELKIKYQKEYQQKNKEKRNLYLSERRNNDPLFKLITNVRNLIYNSFYYNGYSKKSKTQDLLGCSFEEFKNHLESKFENWMNWDNRGAYNGEFNYGWDIDHIIPLSSAKTENDLIELSHYTNLHPLCSKINRDIKKNNIEYDTI